MLDDQYRKRGDDSAIRGGDLPAATPPGRIAVTSWLAPRPEWVAKQHAAAPVQRREAAPAAAPLQHDLTPDEDYVAALCFAAPGQYRAALAEPSAPVQKKDAAPAASAPDVHRLAAAGTCGNPGALPFADRIKASFGAGHVPTIDGIRAHQGSAASDAASAMGAEAYATGSSIVFGAAPTLHTAAHEAAHVVQQRAGVSLKGGVGEAGDAYERHADAVADRVTAGKSAEDLFVGLSAVATGNAGHAVQRKEKEAGGVTSAMPTNFGIDAKTSGAVHRAAVDSEQALQAVRAGSLAPEAACASVIFPVGAAVDALESWSTARVLRALSETMDQAAHRELIEKGMEQLAAACLHLIAAARSASSVPAASLTLAEELKTSFRHARLAGFQPPTTVAEIDARVDDQIACRDGSAAAGKPGCHLPDSGDNNRRELRAKVRELLFEDANEFFNACKREATELEVEIAKDAKWAEIATDALIATLIAVGVGAAAGALGAGAEVSGAATAADASGAGTGAAAADAGGARVASGYATNAVTGGQGIKYTRGVASNAAASAAKETGKQAAKEVGKEVEKEGSRGIEAFAEGLKDLTKGAAGTVVGAGERAEKGDPRQRTVAMLDALSAQVHNAFEQIAMTKLEELDDDALITLFNNLFAADEAIDAAAARFVDAYRVQVEPLGTIDYKDPRMVGGKTLLGASPVVGTMAARVTGRGAPRLAVVKESGLTNWNTMTGELPPPEAILAARYEFVSWVDPAFQRAAEMSAAVEIPVDKIEGLRESDTKGGEHE